MRVAQNEQMTIGEVDISNIRFDPKSRDDIPKILRGLQFIYTNLALRTSIFDLPSKACAAHKTKNAHEPSPPSKSKRMRRSLLRHTLRI